MAESADGVQHAFDKLDNPGLLDNLRTATKGTVNDLQLMQAAVKARDFRIPLEDLGKYLAYAQLKAQETGQSVEYLTDSIIMGLGRQSKQILDNLGLSAAEISEEVAKAGDFVSGVTAIVDRQLASAGDAYISAADKATQATVSLENAQLRLGQALLPLKEHFDKVRIAGTSLLTWIVEYRKFTIPAISAIAAFTLASVKLNTQTKLGISLSKVQNALLTTRTILVKALSVEYNKWTGKTIAAARAQIALNTALKANPWGFALTALTTVLSLLPLFNKRTDETTESLTAMERVSRRMAESEDTTAQRVRSLNKTLHDNTKSIDERRAALKELEDTVPGYLAELTAEGNIINENTAAMTDYINQLNRKAKTQAAQEELTELYKKQWKLQQKVAEGEKKVPGGNNGGSFRMRDLTQLRKDKAELKKITADISTLSTSIFNWKQEDQTSGAAGSKSLLKELEEQRKSLVKARDAATSEEVIAARNREIEQIDAKIQRLQNLGKAVRDTTTIIQESRNKLSADQQRLDDATRDSYQQMLDEKIISQEEFDALMAMAAVKSAETRLKLEQEQAAKISAMSFKTEQDRVKAIADASEHVSDAEHSLANARIKEQQTLNKNIDQLIKSGAKGQELTLDQQEEAELTALDLYLKAALQMVGDNTEKANAIWEAYWDAVFGISHKYAEKREKDLASTRKGLGLVSSEEELQQQLKELKDALDKKHITEEEYQKKSLQLTIESEKARRDAVGLSTYKQDLQLRLMALKEALDQGLLMENEYNAKVRDAKISSWKEQFDYWSNLASNAFESLQQAEIDNSAAKYDILISQAKKAGQDTTALEEEKEAKQLEIQKKYADVNFAVKVSQIIADTAVSIMRAYAELGPIAGSISAALMGVIGAAQIASANAEREKIRNLTAGNSGTASAGSTRVLTGREKGGYITVRRRQDGKLFSDVEVDPSRRGYIDRPTVIVGEGARSKEWVASNAAVENPTVSPILDIIDRAQRAGSIRTLDLNRVIRSRLAGYADGGDIASSRHLRRRQRDTADTVAIPDSGISTLEHLDETLRSLQRDGIPASVALTELDRKRELRDRARKIGSKR